MSRILLFLEHTENRCRSGWGDALPGVAEQSSGTGRVHALLDEAFDLCILDGPSLNHLNG